MGEPLEKFLLFPSVSGNDNTLTKELKKGIAVGEPLAKFRLFPPVIGTDTTLTKEITKRELSGGTP